MRTKTVLASGAVLMLPVLAACSHAAKVDANASALATNPAIVHDKKVVEQDVTSCASSTSILLHPHKNKKAFEHCLEGKGLSPAKVNSCVTHLSLVSFANCLVKK